MPSPATYQLKDSVTTITMDDGKVNVLSPQMLGELNVALDRAAADRAAVVLTGRQGVFSAGFDLPVLSSGGSQAFAMVRAGFELAERILSFPAPVVIGCPGHAVAMGMFLLLSGDYRVGAAGPYKISANEVALGITMPWAAVEICRQRLAPTHLTRAVILAEVFSPSDAVAAGLLDKVVQAAEVPDVTTGIASELAKLDRDAHAASKLRARDHALKAIRVAIETDDAAIRASAGAAQQPGRP